MKLKKARNQFLHYFGKIRRPFAWVVLVAGIVTLIGTILDIIVTKDAKTATILAAIILILEGYDFAQEAEDEAGSPAAKED